ncbi:MAG: hypothetical protein QHH80_13020, partial [Anaerolineae bacterium]|nr:hypothetical protein [Anaerolineae bacterium]
MFQRQLRHLQAEPIEFRLCFLPQLHLNLIFHSQDVIFVRCCQIFNDFTEGIGLLTNGATSQTELGDGQPDKTVLVWLKA